ncbi:MAG: hypothetical protein ACJAQ4_001456 [Cryomorphaceae bacterium]|jgi:hypothetical protein
MNRSNLFPSFWDVLFIFIYKFYNIIDAAIPIFNLTTGANK